MNRPKITKRVKIGAVAAAAALTVGTAGYAGHQIAEVQNEVAHMAQIKYDAEADLTTADGKLRTAIRDTYPVPPKFTSYCDQYAELCIVDLERHPLDYTAVIAYKNHIRIPFDNAVADRLLSAAHKADPAITKVYITEYRPPAERTSPTANGRWVVSAELPIRNDEGMPA